jgi:hypothetical protein
MPTVSAWAVSASGAAAGPAGSRVLGGGDDAQPAETTLIPVSLGLDFVYRHRGVLDDAVGRPTPQRGAPVRLKAAHW